MIPGTRVSGSITAAEIASASAAPTSTAVLAVSVMPAPLSVWGRLPAGLPSLEWKAGPGDPRRPRDCPTPSCGLLIHQAIHGHADAFPPQPAHGNDQKNDERGNGRQRHRHQLDGVLDAADGALHLRAAVFNLPLLFIVDVGPRHLQPARL